MSVKKLALLVTAAVMLAGLPAFAGDGCPGAKQAAAKGDAKACCETAVYVIPGLTDQAVVKSLTTELGKQTGVVSAKADAEAGKFLVTFESAKLSSDDLTKAVAKISPESKFEKVQPAAQDATAKHDCSKCPSKGSCAKAKS